MSESIEQETVKAFGQWVGDEDRVELFWNINGEMVSDKDLRTWCYLNMDYPDKHVGKCVTMRHVIAYHERIK